MRTIRRIALAAALIATGGFSPTLFAQDSGSNDCAAKLATFVRELDDLLARHPRDLNVILALLHRHIPVRSCTADVASRTIKTSAYFKGEERGRGGRSTQFSLSNATASSRGAAILLVLNDTGDWDRPFAIWYPPYP